MAAAQATLHAKGRLGQGIAQAHVGGEPTTHKAPFDLVDWEKGLAYEVKTRAAHVLANEPIGIERASMRRKRAYLREHKLRGRLVVVSIEDGIGLYIAPLKAHVRISAMRKIQ